MTSRILSGQGHSTSPSEPERVKVATELSEVASREVSASTEPLSTFRKKNRLVEFHSFPPALAEYNLGTTSKLPEIIPPEAGSIKLIEILRLIQMDFCSADISQATVNTQRFRDGLEKQNKEITEKQKQIDNRNGKISEESNVLEKAKKALSWVMVIAGIFALVGAILTGNPALIALAAGMLALAIYSAIVSEIPKESLPERTNIFGETVKMDLSINGLVGWLCEITMADPHGLIAVEGANSGNKNAPIVLSRSDFEDYKTGWAIGVNILLIIPSLMLGGAQFSGLLQALSNIAKVGHVLGMVGTAGQILTSLTSICFAIFSGFIAGERRDLATLNIQKEEIQKIITELQTQFDLSHQSFQNSLNFQETLRKMISAAIANYIEQSARISKHCA